VEALTIKKDTIIVLKRGPSGCSIFQHGNRLDVPGFVVKEIDPTGAGDCFSAAFIAGLEARWPLEQVGRFANAAGALAVTQLGPMEGAPNRHEIDKLLSTEKSDN
jgi:sugar/nucleoside kinase (ribokinase family)